VSILPPMLSGGNRSAGAIDCAAMLPHV